MPEPSQSGIRDDRSLTWRDRTVGVFGPCASTFTLAWLASHRGRLRTLILGGRRLSVLVVWDTAGNREVERCQSDLRAIYALTYGEEATGDV